MKFVVYFVFNLFFYFIIFLFIIGLSILIFEGVLLGYNWKGIESDLKRDDCDCKCNGC